MSLRQQALQWVDGASELVPAKLRETLGLRAFGLAKVPMIAFTSPVVEELTDTRCVVRIPLSWRTRNHLGSLYFGALAVGADTAGGLIAMRRIQRSGRKISLVFKDFQASFLRRPEEDVRFVCEQGESIAELVERAAASEERVEMPVRVRAVVASLPESEPVADFTLTLSLKQRRRR